LPARAQIALHNFQLSKRIAQFHWVFERMHHMPKNTLLDLACLTLVSTIVCHPNIYGLRKSVALVWISVE
jgi:hypothetical protein